MSWRDFLSDVELHFNPESAVKAEETAEKVRRNELSERARGRLRADYDVRYGPGPLQVLDIFPAGDGKAPIHVYIHGGYWRRGDKSAASFAAEPFVAAGIPLIALNYDLCPQVTLDQLVSEVMDGIEWVHRNAARIGGDGNRLYLSGHSGGAHLTAMALAHDWAKRGLREDFIVGAAPITGIYDIEPMLHISVNQQVRLKAEMVRRNSPMFNPPLRPVPILFALGTSEMAGWAEQTLDYEKVCRSAGCHTELIWYPGHNHYSMTLATHGDPDSPVLGKIIAQLTAPGPTSL
jgi:arylformamidase